MSNIAEVIELHRAALLCPTGYCIFGLTAIFRNRLLECCVVSNLSSSEKASLPGPVILNDLPFLSAFNIGLLVHFFLIRTFPSSSAA
ncbi:hypothetical protein EDD22DRAFT_896726 [Suillus occidentalis]|nr:hypothetical protein EDD22DRAFT_896726 [Suillus occidentalis]